MIKDYISVDIENPNTRGNSICSIGIIVVKNNEVEEKIYSLINPEDRFDENNNQITGLCYSDVKNSPNFKEYWEEISNLFENNVVVGHNIIYDLNVIAKSLARYDMDMPTVRYFCTLEIVKNNLDLSSYSLHNVCNHLNITLKQHHNALEDARVAQEIFQFFNANDDIGHPLEFKYEYKISESLDSKLETNINSLYGIVQGINYDGIIDEKEIEKIKTWVEENKLYNQYALFNRIIDTLDKILADNIISEYEKIELMALVKSINVSKRYSEATLALQILNGILDGIVCNQKINQKEIEKLQIWLDKNDYLKDVYPYDKILLEVNKVLGDEILSEEESEYILTIFDDIVNPKISDKDNIDFNGKTFCLTGEFESASKLEVSKKIQALGGIEKSGVSSKLDYLIVGEVGSEAWKFGKIGGKQAKAQELNEKGAKIKIIDESNLKI